MPIQCGECRYLDTKNIVDGQGWCERKEERRFADDTYADSCSKFFRLGWGHTSEGKQAIWEAEKYKKEHSSSGCYITTAVVNILGFADNCETMNILRTFRRQVLQKDAKYRSILLQYDCVGPKIAFNLQRDENAYEVASDLYFSYLVKAVCAIKENDIDRAIAIYTAMTEKLISEYLQPNELIISSDIEKNYNQSQGGHGRLSFS